MKLKDWIKPAIPPLAEGTYLAVIIGVADIGDQYSAYYKKTSRKMVLTFDIPGETIEIDGELQTRQVSKTMTVSGGQTSNCYKLITVLVPGLNPENFRDFDTDDLLGIHCMVSLTVSEDGQYNNVDSAMRLPKGVPAVDSNKRPWSYSVEEGFDKLNQLPEWLQNRVKKSEQYKAIAPPEKLDIGQRAAVDKEEAEAAAELLEERKARRARGASAAVGREEPPF